MQKARRHHTKWLRPLVCDWFQVLFTPFIRVLFTFPSRYLFTIGLLVVFSLSRWCWQIHTGFHRPRATQDTARRNFASCTGLSPSTVCFPKQFHSRHYHIISQSYNPLFAQGLGCSPFARHYLGNHYCFLFLRVLRCFSSPGFLSLEYIVFNYVGCPIRTSTDNRMFAPTRSFSQLTTSFVVSRSLGIRQSHLFAFYSFLSKPLLLLNYYCDLFSLPYCQ